jgi:hypothetical protein
MFRGFGPHVSCLEFFKMYQMLIYELFETCGM